uniref:Uncharacterized protein n=1 Tax=Setaria digitata TaxID=48799 RepID=A0A915PEY2_9BILA
MGKNSANRMKRRTIIFSVVTLVNAIVATGNSTIKLETSAFEKDQAKYPSEQELFQHWIESFKQSAGPESQLLGA